MKFSSVFTSALLFSTGFASNVIIADNSNFDDIVYKSGKDSLVEFYASWCGHCKKLAPVWDELADTYQNVKDVQIVKIECDENKVTCSQFGIKGFPTLKYFKRDMSNPVDYEGGRDLESFIKFIGQHSDSYVYIPKVQSNVVQLSDLDFDDYIGKDQNVFVVFTASWCGHCKNLHPIWEEVANVFQNDDDVIIAEVSTTDSPSEELKNRYSITGFPSILSFKKGDTHHIPFESSRNLVGITDWVNKVAGTHRTTDGGLLDTAGRISELDDKIKEMLQESPSKINELATELLGQIEEGGEYYRKLLNKIINGEDAFFTKETKRLEKLLSNSKNLAKDKKDSLQKRLNVLKVFQTQDE